MPDVADYRILFTADDSGFKKTAGDVSSVLGKIDAALNSIGTKFDTLAGSLTKAATAFNPAAPEAYLAALKGMSGLVSSLSPEFAGLATDVKLLNIAFNSKAPLTYGNRLSASGGTAIDMADKVKIAAKEVAALNAELLKARNLRSISINTSGGAGGGSSGFDLKNIAQAGRQVGTSLTRTITVPLLAVGAAATFVGVQFEAAMSKIQGLAGVSKTQTDAWSASLLKLGPAVGKTPTELAEGLFHVASEGYRGTEAIEILTRAAKMSAIGMGDMVNASKALVFVMHDYAASGMTAAMASDTLTAAVRVGNMTADTLTNNLGKVLPVAAALKVSFADVAAAFVTLTREGSTTAQAATAITAVLTTIQHPSQAARKGIEELAKSTGDSSLNFAELRKEMQDNLLGALIHVANAAKGSDTAFTNVFGSVRNLRGTLGILGSNLKESKDLFAQMRDTVGSVDKAFDVTAATADQKFKQALAGLEVAGISLFKTLAPSILAVVNRVKDAALAFANWDEGTKKLVVTSATLLAVLGPGILVLSRIASGVILYRAAVDLLNQRLAAQAIAQTAANAAIAGAVPAAASAAVGVSALGNAMLTAAGKGNALLIAMRAVQLSLLDIAAVAAIPMYVGKTVLDLANATADAQNAQGSGSAMATMGLQGYIKARRVKEEATIRADAEKQAHKEAAAKGSPYMDGRRYSQLIGEHPRLSEQQIVNDYKKTRDYRQLVIGGQGAAGRNKAVREGNARDALAATQKKVQDSLNPDLYKDHGATDPPGKEKKAKQSQAGKEADQRLQAMRDIIANYAHTIRMYSSNNDDQDRLQYGDLAKPGAQNAGIAAAMQKVTGKPQSSAPLGDAELKSTLLLMSAYIAKRQEMKDADKEAADAKKEADKENEDWENEHRQAGFDRMNELAQSRKDATDKENDAIKKWIDARTKTVIKHLDEAAKYATDLQKTLDKYSRKDATIEGATSITSRQAAVASNAKGTFLENHPYASAADLDAIGRAAVGSDQEEITKRQNENAAQALERIRTELASTSVQTDATRLKLLTFSKDGIAPMSDENAKLVISAQKAAESMQKLREQIAELANKGGELVGNIFNQFAEHGTRGLANYAKNQLQTTTRGIATQYVSKQATGLIDNLLGGKQLDKNAQLMAKIDAQIAAINANTSALGGKASSGFSGALSGMPEGINSGPLDGLGALDSGTFRIPSSSPSTGAAASGEVNQASGILSLLRGLPGFASGGDYQAGKPRIVGEHGPEIDVPGQSGHVFPNGSGDIGGNTYAHTTHIHIYGDGSGIGQDTIDQIHAAAFEGGQQAYARFR